MIFLSLDFESTGLSPINDRIIEIGAVLYSTSQKRILDTQGSLVQTNKVVSSEITQITGIQQSALDRFGYDENSSFDILIELTEQADAIIGYNCRAFDQKILNETVKRIGRELSSKVWIDVFMDLPWQVKTCRLSHTAADHGFLNMFPHSALADALTVLGIAQHYDSQMLFERAQSPVVIVYGVHDRSQNEQVKRAKFRWNPERKIWWKQIKLQDVDEYTAQLSFPTKVSKFTLEELE